MNNIKPNNNWLSTSDSALQYAFGTTTPEIANYPHCLFPAGEASFQSLIYTIREPIGVWGNLRIPYDFNGDAYLEPSDGRIISDFKLWGLPANQNYARQQGACGSTDFTMVISSNTDEKVLARIYESDIGEDHYDYYKCIRLLSDWIDDLGWAYVPLEYEAIYGMFVAAVRNQTLVDQMKLSLLKIGMKPVFQIIFVDGKHRWAGPLHQE